MYIDVNQLVQAVTDLGINLSASAIYTWFQTRFPSGGFVGEKEQFMKELTSFMTMNGFDVQARTVIEAYAARGHLQITNTSFYGPNGVVIGAGPDGVTSFGYDSVSRTNDTAVIAQGNANAVARNATMVQSDGAIKFYVGK
jgi:hypothetical protein